MPRARCRRLGCRRLPRRQPRQCRRDAGIAHLASGRRAPRARARIDVALVGKGVLFDTGGTNLKPHRSMLDMHTDMAGSAVALATLVALRRAARAIASRCLARDHREQHRPERPIGRRKWCAPLNGTTIQVIHSDAEGRMALADTLALAARAQAAR